MLGFRRVLAVLAATSAIAFLGSSPALAAPNPGPVPVPPPFPLVDNFCGDLGPITVSAVLDNFNASMHVFVSKDGTTRILFTGHQRTIVQGNGKTLNFDSSGPLTIIIFPNHTVTAVAEGHLFYIGPPGSSQPGLFLYSGLTVIDVSQPIATVASHHGKVTDLCAMLR